MTPPEGDPDTDSIRTFTFMIHILHRRLLPQFQVSLSAADLGMYLYGTSQPHHHVFHPSIFFKKRGKAPVKRQ
jgi:hypothetical protein